MIAYWKNYNIGLFVDRDLDAHQTLLLCDGGLQVLFPTLLGELHASLRVRTASEKLTLLICWKKKKI